MADDRDILPLLRDVPLFEGFSERELRDLLAVGRVVRHPAGSEVAREGRDAVGFHLILDGTATIVRHGKEGGTIGPKAYFGEIALLDGKPRSATVRAAEPMRTFSITAWEFGPLLDRHPPLVRKLLTGLCGQLRAAEAERGSEVDAGA